MLICRADEGQACHQSVARGLSEADLEVLLKLIRKHERQQKGVLIAIGQLVDWVRVRIEEPEVLQHVSMSNPAT